MADRRIRQDIAECVAPEILRDIIKRQKGHKASNLYKDDETLMDELFRVCPDSLILQIFEQFCLLKDLNLWFHGISEKLSLDKSWTGLKENLKESLFEGITPKNTDETPVLFHVVKAAEMIVFRYAARDGRIVIPIALGRTEEQRYVNQYEVVMHFSAGPYLIVAGALSKTKSFSVLEQFTQDVTFFLPLGSEPVHQPRGKSKQFYWRFKRALSARLIKTKRDDLQGNYKTITLEARHAKPDLDEVRDFIRRYRDANSYYDVLEFTQTNKVGARETTNVKFGHPYGRFTFRKGTSLALIDHAFNKVSDALSGL